jgi:hypothetical protein
MGQRHAYWVIVTGTTATAFRARYREDLLPTLTQLQRKTPDAVLQWFDRGKLWPSPEAAREALKAERQRSRPRDREWRPGGNHKDPRARFKLSRDQKRARFKKRAAWSRQKPAEGDRPDGRPPSGDRRRSPEGWRGKPRAGWKDEPRPDWRDKPGPEWRGKPRPDWRDKPRPDWRGKPRADARPGDRRPGRPPFKPGGDRPGRPPFKPGGNRPVRPPFKAGGNRRPQPRPQGEWRPRKRNPDEDERKKGS